MESMIDKLDKVDKIEIQLKMSNWMNIWSYTRKRQIKITRKKKRSKSLIEKNENWFKFQLNKCLEENWFEIQLNKI